jgi:plasmid stabilization system protein ParE
VNRRLVVRSRAEQDLVDAQKWYEEQRSGLGEEFRITVDGLISRILERPRLYPEVYRKVRRAVMRRFPYLLYFILTDDVVVVIGCLHSRRNPALLRSRVP